MVGKEERGRGMKIGGSNEWNVKGIREKGGKEYKVQKKSRGGKKRAKYEGTKEIFPC
jgi:hypothetical protein